MRHLISCFVCVLAYATISAQPKSPVPPPSIADKTQGAIPYEGFFNFYWDALQGKIYLEIDQLDQEVLYVNSLTGGVGSNDIGLDRNQLGDTRVVKFQRSGPKILMVQPNYDYRAVSDNADERAAVETAFAQSVLSGFKIIAETDGRVLIDFTPFLLRDAHGVAKRLKSGNQGHFKVNTNSSAIHLERTKNFPENSEFDAIITFSGEATGRHLRSVTPSNEAFTVRMHHSLVKLPDDDYQPRLFDPRSGYYPLSYADYATPISSPLVKRFIQRHRLKKKNPTAAKSEAVEPIVYYLDRGCPEPIASALIEGARWWNQAFEAAGYIDAFQVKRLPEGADPLDVRYNLINWVHRSTRGWSYGTSVTDPRTGEIIKGHVLLGSLRVRQDFMIAQGLVEAYQNGDKVDPRLEQLALARLRQLSAHEIGHTLGLMHNFAASTQDRASVMDYPHPLITLDIDQRMQLENAYAVGIGEWDKRTIIYGYKDLSESTDEWAELQAILAENEALGFRYMSDRDSRPVGGAHPYAHLWDNGTDAAKELERIMELRQTALGRLGLNNLRPGSPQAALEELLVPVYLGHRYQVEGAAKLIGGVHYDYVMYYGSTEAQKANPVGNVQQEAAIDLLLKTLQPDFLSLPAKLERQLLPQPPGYNRGRENFNSYTGLTFDPMSAAEASIQHTFTYLLNHERLARMIQQHTDNKLLPAPEMIFYKLNKQIHKNERLKGKEQQLAFLVEKQYVQHLLQLAMHPNAMPEVKALATRQLVKKKRQYAAIGNSRSQKAHARYLRRLILLYLKQPEQLKDMMPQPVKIPAGSPIGCGEG